MGIKFNPGNDKRKYFWLMNTICYPHSTLFFFFFFFQISLNLGKGVWEDVRIPWLKLQGTSKILRLFLCKYFVFSYYLIARYFWNCFLFILFYFGVTIVTHNSKCHSNNNKSKNYFFQLHQQQYFVMRSISIINLYSLYLFVWTAFHHF